MANCIVPYATKIQSMRRKYQREFNISGKSLGHEILATLVYVWVVVILVETLDAHSNHHGYPSIGVKKKMKAKSLDREISVSLIYI